VVEAGPFVDETAMPADELDAYRRVYLNHGLLTTWDGAITMLAGTAVGGGTLVNWMTSLPAAASSGPSGLATTVSTGSTARSSTRTSRRSNATSGSAGDGHPAEGPGDPARRRLLGWEASPTRRNATAAATAAAARSAARGAPSSPGSASTSRGRDAAGARIVERARVTRVLVEGGYATGIEARMLRVDPATHEALAGTTGDPLSRRRGGSSSTRPR
jgi:hypothetical protein